MSQKPELQAKRLSEESPVDDWLRWNEWFLSCWLFGVFWELYFERIYADQLF